MKVSCFARYLNTVLRTVPAQRGRNSRKDSAILNYPFSILHFICFLEKNK